MLNSPSENAAASGVEAAAVTEACTAVAEVTLAGSGAADMAEEEAAAEIPAEGIKKAGAEEGECLPFLFYNYFL